MIGNSPLQSIHLAPDIVCTIPAVSVRVSEAVAFLGGKAPGASKTLGSSSSCCHSLLENDLSLCPDHGSNLIQPTATGVPVPLPPSFEFSMPGISTFCHALPIHVPWPQPRDGMWTTTESCQNPGFLLTTWPWSSSKMFQTQSSFFPANLAVIFQPRDCFHCGSGCSCCFWLVPAAPSHRCHIPATIYILSIYHKGITSKKRIATILINTLSCVIVWKSANAKKSQKFHGWSMLVTSFPTEWPSIGGVALW